MPTSPQAAVFALKAAGSRLSPTIGNKQWLLVNKEKVLHALPAEWTDATDDSLTLRFGFQLKLLDVEWKEKFDLLVIFYWLSKLGWTEVSKNEHKQNSLLIRKKQ